MTMANNSSDWTQTLPDSWGSDRLGKFADIIVSNVDKKSYDDETPVRLCNYVDVYKNDFITSDVEFMDATASDHEINKFALNVGDVLATKDSENPMDIAVPALVKEDLPGVLCGYHLAIVRADGRRLLGAFAAWLHLSRSIGQHYEKHATGITRWAIGKRDFKTCPVPLPPIDEQQRIADYLDASCEAIDRAVETKQKQLDTLDALRKSIIQKAVTQGLDPNVPMKDSGALWFPRVPEHWKVGRLKGIAELLSGYAFDSRTYIEDGTAIIRISEVVDSPDLSIAKRVPNDFRETLSRFLLQTGDVLIAMTGATIGKSAVFRCDEPCFLNQRVGAFRPINSDDVFIAYLIKSELVREQIDIFCYGSAQPNIGRHQLENMIVPIPPRCEQSAIADFLLNRLRQIDQVAAVTRDQIRSLNAYRKSLIHECVTGKRRISEDDVAKVKSHV
ncbi:restriction endonuclease subunit S [Crateriforma conspicua]|uniref:restriction endonuclease subunit S n=1 Tax=Crateriforma conspicua TaxID=2527996 RepID=UPI00118A3CFE|nr:restriction endonuclease subunit S [Crateriforma conspicua]QDV62757.1 Type-1 restriction enzyme EcoKI specificity protein [Crateriforma conspicua]